MLEAVSLHKRYGPIHAVRGISFRVEKGEVLGFLGPNGAGKSTTMRMAAGFLPPTSGTALVGGHDVIREPVAAKKLLGYLPENAPVYGDMVVENFLRFVADIRGYRGQDRARRVDAAIETCHLQEVRHQPVETLSKGYKHRVCFAQAILHDPPVLIMDEPTDGLDPNQKHVVRTMIKSMSSQKAIIISTHILEEVDAVCTRAIIIGSGQIVANGTPKELKARSPSHGAVELTLREASPEAENELRRLRCAARVAAEGGVYTVFPRKDENVLPDVTALVHDRGWQPVGMRVLEGRLDEVFRDLTVGMEQVRKAN